MVQEKMQAMRREFETISMKRNEKVDEYSNYFVHVVTSMRDLGESHDEYSIVSRLHMSFAK